MNSFFSFNQSRIHKVLLIFLIFTVENCFFFTSFSFFVTSSPLLTFKSTWVATKLLPGFCTVQKTLKNKNASTKSFSRFSFILVSHIYFSWALQLPSDSILKYVLSRFKYFGIKNEITYLYYFSHITLEAYTYY